MSANFLLTFPDYGSKLSIRAGNNCFLETMVFRERLFPTKRERNVIDMAERHGSLSIDSENIFPIIKKWLYSDHDIFYRELISNGCDAITKRKKLDVMGESHLPEDYKLRPCRCRHAQQARPQRDRLRETRPHRRTAHVRHPQHEAGETDHWP